MITLQNTTKATYEHGKYKLNPEAIKEVPDKIANIWLNIPGVIEYINPAEAKAKEAKAEGEIKALQKENDELKAKIAELKKEAKAKGAKAEGEKTSKDK